MARYRSFVQHGISHDPPTPLVILASTEATAVSRVLQQTQANQAMCVLVGLGLVRLCRCRQSACVVHTSINVYEQQCLCRKHNGGSVFGYVCVCVCVCVCLWCACVSVSVQMHVRAFVRLNISTTHETQPPCPYPTTAKCPCAEAIESAITLEAGRRVVW